MAENKKYYWLKLKKDFFKRHDIQIIEAMPNGKDYVLFYLKMLLESVDHDGSLRFNDTIPYNEAMLSTITNTNIDIVRNAMKVFTDLKMIEILNDSTVYMSEVNKMLGTETYWAEQKRKQRIGQCPQNVLALSNVSNQEIELDIEIDIEKEKDTNTEGVCKANSKTNKDYQLIADMYNEVCTSLPSVSTLSEARKKALKARLNSYTVVDFKKLFKAAEESDFLKGKGTKDWMANFDWLIKDANMAKVLDGNYKNKGGEKDEYDDYVPCRPNACL